MSYPSHIEPPAVALEQNPTTWQWKKLKFIARFKSGDGITSDDIAEAGDFPVFGGNGIRGYANAYTHDGDYVLIGRQRALCGNVNFASGKFWASEHAVVASLNRGHNVKWFGEMLRVLNLNRYSQSAAQPGLAVEKIQNLAVLVPPPADQRRIAAYLDAATGKIDRLMGLRRRQMELLREQRAALIQQAVTRGLNPRAPLKDSGLPWIGQIPQHWQLLPLRGVLTERGAFNTDLRTTDFLSVLKDVGVVPYEEREASGNKKSDDLSQYKIIHPGDIVANRMNLIFGSVGLSAHFGCSSTEYYVLKARNASIDTRFYGLIFQSKAFQRSLVGIGSGILAHRMRIYYEALKKVLLPVPSLKEQQDIVAHVEKENERCDALHRSYVRQLALLAEYRAALIHECVTGQRRV